MACSQTRFKFFLVSSNVALLFVGLSVIILGIKMYQLLTVLRLADVPLIDHAVEAVIATGFFISFAGFTGLTGACSEALWIILVHLISMGLIVMMEFGLGVTLLIVRKTVENYMTSMKCDSSCATSLDNLVLEYALPSAGLMLSIIIVEATMMYSALRLCSHIRDTPKVVEDLDADTLSQNVQMGRVGLRSNYTSSPLPVFSPRVNYLPSRMHAFNEQPSPLVYPHQGSPKPPQYSTLPWEDLPPTYMEVVPGALTNVTPRTSEGGRPGTCNSV